jgi:hypothetical protein
MPSKQTKEKPRTNNHRSVWAMTLNKYIGNENIVCAQQNEDDTRFFREEWLFE